MPQITIEPIPSETKYLKQFIKFAWTVYADDPHWVPPLILDHLNRLDPAKDPYHQHSETQLFVARRNGQIVGRISASIDEVHNQVHNEKTGFFGWFECLNDPEIATALFDAAREWLSARGMTIMRGPANFTSNHEWGLLIDAFDQPPVVLMTYNPPYYVKLIESYGFRKARDLYAFYLSTAGELNPRIVRISEKIKKKHNIRLRQIDMRRFDEDLQLVKELYRAAWEQNWGFIPLNEAEMAAIAADMKKLLKPELFLFGEIDDEPVGFSVTLPDINQALHHINGRLFPIGLLKFLYYLKKVNQVRLVLLGIKPGFRKRGLDSLFYVETFRRAKALGYRGGEISWTLEDNILVNRAIESMGGQHYKTYRIYDYPVTPAESST